MPIAEDPAALLKLAADIAKAGRDPVAWPGVFEQIAALMECSAVFRGELFSGAGTDDEKAAIAASISGNAASCVRDEHGRCAEDTAVAAQKRRICQALVEHLELAGRAYASDGDSFLGSLDAIPRPLFAVRRDARLLHANAAGWRELGGANWLAHENGALCLQPRRSRTTLHQYLARLPNRPSGGRDCLRLSNAGQGTAELWAKPLGADDDREHCFLLSLVTGEGHQASLAPLHGLTPRQQELARHLLAGNSLSQAAKNMGIERRTAKDHLSALFEYSQTRRQTELVAWLTRQELS